MTPDDPPSQRPKEPRAHKGSSVSEGASPTTPKDNPDAAPIDPLAEARAEAQRLKDQWMRVAADFDNFRKRTRRDIEDAKKGGREELVKELLPVFDNLERAIQSAARATEVKGVADGLSMVVKQFVDVLARTGISKVKTTGSVFDPAVHEAIQQIETDEHPVGTVVAEVQPGYLSGDRLVRAAMVVVAKPKRDPGAPRSDLESERPGAGSEGKAD
jgi:molecular chaperone GrpE